MQHLCKGATLMCTGGTSPSQLDVSPSRAIFIDNKPVANVADHIPMVNIKPFGNCTLMAPISPPPCMPATPSPWNSPNSTIKIDHQMALTFGCSLQCSIGGTIKCVDPGQVEVVGGNITPVSVAHSDSGGSSESNGNDDSQNDESKHSSHNQAQHLSHDSNVNSQGERVSRIPLGAGAGNEYDVSSIDFHRIRGLQASKIKLACTQCAVRTMKYLISGENKYLKLPLLPKTTAQTKEQVVISCNKGGFLSKRNKEIKEIKGGLFDIQSFERKFEYHPAGTVAFLFGGVNLEGEGYPIGHALIAYKTEDGIKYLDSTTPDHFDLAFDSPQIYFENGFFSLSKRKQAKWMKYFEGLIVSEIGS